VFHFRCAGKAREWTTQGAFAADSDRSLSSPWRIVVIPLAEVRADSAINPVGRCEKSYKKSLRDSIGLHPTADAKKGDRSI
jgi:hypothetical protein